MHIGTHKTGTTSFQRSIHDMAKQLGAAGVHAIDSTLSGVRGWPHEIPLAITRQSLALPLRRMFPEFARVDDCERLRKHVSAQVRADHESIIVSHEALSLLRSDAELEQLKDVLTGHRDRRPLIAVVLRDKEAYLRSMRGQLSRMGMLDADPRPGSMSDLAADSWLVDYQAMIDLYGRHFGAGSVVVVDYEGSLQRHGSVLPALWSACGLDHLVGQPPRLWLNRSPTQGSE